MKLRTSSLLGSFGCHLTGTVHIFNRRRELEARIDKAVSDANPLVAPDQVFSREEHADDPRE